MRKIFGLLFTFLIASTLSAPALASNPNDPRFWEANYSNHGALCYKHTADSAHGSLVERRKAVSLVPFDPAWPGDHWEVLIVKGGAEDIGFGAGNAVYEHPSAGAPYFPPLNGGGNKPEISHWIVCKGSTPTTISTSPTSTTTTTTTTTTTVPEATTTTTTTTAPEEIITTTLPTTTPTQPEVTTTTNANMAPPTTTAAPTTTTSVDESTTTIPTTTEAPLVEIDDPANEVDLIIKELPATGTAMTALVTTAAMFVLFGFVGMWVAYRTKK